MGAQQIKLNEAAIEIDPCPGLGRRFCGKADFYRTGDGFTLVELLATVMVVTLLVLLGLPTLVRANQRTKQASCQSNLRQLGLALQAYAGANAGRLPGPVSLLLSARQDSASTNELSWYLASRLENAPSSAAESTVTQLLCPSHDSGPDAARPAQSRTDYVLNDGRGLGGPPFGRPGSNAASPLSLTAITAITSPAECAAVADADKGNVNPTLPGWSALPYQPVHGKVRNQLYFDWHVESKAW